jgi:hypothetical protein
MGRFGLLLAGLNAAAQAPERADYVATLGRDTVALESYVRTARTLSGSIVLRIPATVMIRYEIGFGQDGNVARSTFAVEPLASVSFARHRTTLEFGADSIRVRLDSAGITRRSALPAAPDRIPFLTTGFGATLGLYASVALQQLALEGLPSDGADSVLVPVIGALTGRPGSRSFFRRSATRVDVDYFRIAWTHLALDGAGRVDTVDALETTERTLTRRVPPFDLRGLARDFARRDRAGRGLGLASRRDSVRTTVDGVTVAIDYTSPRRRGRSILGSVVPFGQVWRTGADAATTLFLSRPLRIGGTLVPAGPYSLWTIPERDGVVLIVNRQYGQWGTEYRAERDLARIPLEAGETSPPREDFVILVRSRTTGGSELVIAWDTFEWKVPIGAR